MPAKAKQLRITNCWNGLKFAKTQIDLNTPLENNLEKHQMSASLTLNYRIKNHFYYLVLYNSYYRYCLSSYFTLQPHMHIWQNCVTFFQSACWLGHVFKHIYNGQQQFLDT